MQGRRFLAFVLLACAATPGSAQVLVRQSGIGYTIDPYPDPQTVVDFYSYDQANPDSADTGFEEEGSSLLMLHQQTSGSHALSLVVINDAPGGASEEENEAVFRFFGLPAASLWAVYDEPLEQHLNGDHYAPDPIFNGRTSGDWGWYGCCTDGGAIQGLEVVPFCVSVYASFDAGIDRWDLGTGGLVDRITLPNLDDPVYLCKDCQTLTCPTLVTAECTGGTGTWVDVLASGDSLCDGDQISNSFNGGGFDASDYYPSGTTLVRFRLTDTPGFESFCETTVFIDDIEDPVVAICPPALELACDGRPIPITDPRVVSWIDGFEATDNCGPPATLTDLPPEIPQVCTPTPLVVTFTARDGAGNTDSCTSTVLNIDDDAPTISNCPAPVDLECSDPGGVAVTDPRVASFLASFAAADACGNVSLGNDAPALFPTGCGPEGTVTAVLFTATDDCGLVTTCSSKVTVRDTVPPAVTCPPDGLVECSTFGGTPSTHPAVEAWRAGFIGTDACGTVDRSDDLPTLLPAGCAPGAATPTTFTGTDGCGHATSCGAMVSVVDSLPPAISLCPAPIALECNAPGGVRATDPAVVALIAAIAAADICGDVTYTNDAPTLFPSACAPGQKTDLELKAIDGCDNAADCYTGVTVEDTTAPSVWGPAPLTLECSAPGGVPAVAPLAAAWLGGFGSTDACDAAFARDLDAPAFFPAGCAPGRQTVVNYTATDNCGNQGEVAVPLTVVDSTAPTVTAILMPLIPLPPRPPAPSCAPPTSRYFRVDCGLRDQCDVSATMTAKLIVTRHEVPVKGVCSKIVEEIPVACGDVVELELQPSPCPDKLTKPSRDTGLWDPTTGAEVFDPPFPLIIGESIVLQVTAIDNCSNQAIDTFDPRVRPSPLCDERLVDGSCCPAVLEAPDEKCKTPLCGRCQPTVLPVPIVTAVTGVGVGCTKEAAERAALDEIGRENCLGPADPGCEGTCREDYRVECSLTSNKRGNQSRIACRDITLAGCPAAKGKECTALGAFDCGCGCY